MKAILTLLACMAVVYEESHVGTLTPRVTYLKQQRTCMLKNDAKEVPCALKSDPAEICDEQGVRTPSSDVAGERLWSSGALCQSIRSDFVLLNQPYPFPGNASGCRQAEWRKTNPTANIATYQNQACTTSEGLEEEYRCEDNHLLLKSAKFNDAGSYEFICNWDIISIRLDVLYAQDVSAVETENIILNCYAHSTEDVTWLHNKKIILHVKMNGSASFSKDYEGRVSVKKSCFKTGDFSLTIARVLKEDAGTYRCFVDDETKKGIPQASVLHVNEKRSSPGDQTQRDCIFYKTTTIFLGVLLGISVIVMFVITFKLCRSRSTVREGDTETSRDLLSDIRPRTPVCESQPSEESSSTGNKTSSTIPFTTDKD
ncbi:uncharacterized protein LOC122360496 isoform X2 [Puntigrus tetrazona]|uniref:uncharacterized protein LOC122360496 isoform X2 n=1 Tax=Puntigrus tetrazona TaxID=1606681 RepID=UPI001C8A981B|nr:uncharacterized protein LOC122360496 isoform X2 [Puntigrus tetrazona]